MMCSCAAEHPVEGAFETGAPTAGIKANASTMAPTAVLPSDAGACPNPASIFLLRMEANAALIKRSYAITTKPAGKFG